MRGKAGRKPGKDLDGSRGVDSMEEPLCDAGMLFTEEQRRYGSVYVAEIRR